MQRICLLPALLLALTVFGPASAKDTVEPTTLQLNLQLEADDTLLESGGPLAGGGQSRARVADRGTANRAGRGYQVRAVLPSLCEDGLPGGQVVDTYNRVMDCEDDAVGVSISIRNY